MSEKKGQFFEGENHKIVDILNMYRTDSPASIAKGVLTVQSGLTKDEQIEFLHYQMAHLTNVVRALQETVAPGSYEILEAMPKRPKN